MSDLTDFLSARLDDDEAWAKAGYDAEWPEFNEPETPGHHERVLADVTAKRGIVDRHRPHDPAVDIFEGCVVCLTDRDGFKDYWQPDPWPCATLRTLAAVYSNHPDYRGEWRP